MKINFSDDDQAEATDAARGVLPHVAALHGTEPDDPMTVTYALNALLMAAYELALMHSIEPDTLTGAVKRHYAALYWASGQDADSAKH